MSNISDSLLIPVSIFALVVILVFVVYIANTLSGTSFFNTSYMTYGKNALNIIIALIPLIMLGMSLGAIVSSLLVRTHPIFFGVAIILLICELFIVPILTNVFNAIVTSSPTIQATVLPFSVIITIMQNLTLITFVLSCLAVIVSYMRGI